MNVRRPCSVKRGGSPNPSFLRITRQVPLFNLSSRYPLEAMAMRLVQGRRAAAVKRWGRGIRYVDHPLRSKLQLLRGRTLLSEAARPAQDRRIPGGLDRVAWLHREARAWHTFALQGLRPALELDNTGPAVVLGKGPKRSRKPVQLRLVGAA